MEAVARPSWLLFLAWGSLVAACGGRANQHDSAAGSNEAGTSAQTGGATAGGAWAAGGAAKAGAASAGRGPDDGGEGGAQAHAGEGGEAGAEVVGGGAGGASPGAGGQELGGGGATTEKPSIAALLGNYDVYLAAPPTVAGCEVAWYEPRINLSVDGTDWYTLALLPFADFFWQGNDATPPELTASKVQVAARSDWTNSPASPALELDWNEQGFLGTGSAEIPYTCEDGSSPTRAVAVTLEADHTSPKLSLVPDGYGSFAFTRYGVTFSEPIGLPNGEYDVVFRETADAEGAVELYDVDTNATLPTAWKWALAGPYAQAHFVDPASAEGRTMAARVVATLSDRAGNPLIALEETFEIAPAAVLESELDFDQEPAAGLYGNASYHATAEAGAPCEAGGCLVLDGPVTPCNEAPASTFAVRLGSPWDKPMNIRYRVWASTGSVSPIGIGYASGCSGTFPATLSPLAQPDGPFTHASDWTTRAVSPCGGPENETGFTLSLACAESDPPPAVRVVIERLTREP